MQTDFIYVIASDLPQAPVNPPTIVSVTKTSISITLDPIPLASNGSPITGYIVLIDGLGGQFRQVHDSMNLDLTISNLKSGRTYRVKYAGRNKVYD